MKGGGAMGIPKWWGWRKGAADIGGGREAVLPFGRG